MKTRLAMPGVQKDGNCPTLPARPERFLGQEMPSGADSVMLCEGVFRLFCTLLYRRRTDGCGPELQTEQAL